MARRPVVRCGRGLGLALAGVLGVLFSSAKLETASLIATAHAGERLASTASTPTASVAADSISPAGTLELSGLQDQFAAVAKRVGPSVVAISASLDPVAADDAVHADALNGDALSRTLDRTTRTVGTGLVIDAGGYILTNEHVVGEAQQLWITTDDRKVYPAIVVASDPRCDLAVLKAPAKTLTPVRFATGSPTRGQWTIALGNPYGLAAEGEMAMSVGVVSAVDRSLPKLANKENRLYTDLIQTTAEINPGNSGGPLFNLAGEVIGINTAVIFPQKQTNGIGFALPITKELLADVEELKQGHEIVYAYVGVSVSTATSRDRKDFADHDRELGVFVDSVEQDAPATDHLRNGDVIVAINNQPISDSDHFVRMVGRIPIGEASEFRIYREGKSETINLTPRKRRLPSVAVTRESQRLRWRGLLLGPVPAHWTVDGKSKPGKGLMILGVDAKSPLLTRGAAQGSVISTVAGVAVSSIDQLQEILSGTPEEKCSVEFADAPQTALVTER